MPLTDEAMAASRHGRGDGAGDSHQRAAEVMSVPGGGEGTTVRRSLDHDGAQGECGDDAVSEQEALPGRRRTWWPFSDHGTLGRDGIEQTAVRARVGDVGTAGEDGDSHTASGQAATVCRCVDPARAA